MRSLRSRMVGAFVCLSLLPAASPAAESSSAVDGRPDVAAMWREFLAREDGLSGYDGYELLDKIGYDLHQVDPEGCRQQGQALAEAVQAAPVSIALHHASVLCAQATGDQERAERDGVVLEALSRHALSQVSDLNTADPVRLLSTQDGYSLIALMGLETSYGYYVRTMPDRYMPFVLVAWDEETQTERHLIFDVVDTMNALVRSDPYSGYPYQRVQLALGVLEGQKNSGLGMANDVMALRDSYDESTPAAKIEKLRGAASEGGLHATGAWMALCEASPHAGCSDGLAEALLAAAETQHALPMAMLAYAYAQGLGAERDEAAATALLDAADRRWPRGGASAFYATFWLVRHQGAIPAFVQSRIDAARRLGNPNIDGVVLYRQASASEPKLDADDIARLAHADYNARGAGYAIVAGFYARTGDDDNAREWTRRAAEAGDADSMASQGARLMRGDGVPRDKQAARSLFVEAAHGGSAFAARMLAYEAMEDGKWQEAMAWLLAPMSAGDIQALIDGAGIYEFERPGFAGEQERALAIYTSLADDNDVAEARRRLAGMALQGRGMPKDPRRAEAWLRQDAEKGDHQSEMMLGSSYLSGEYGRVDETEGRRWMEKAMAAGNQDAFSDFGLWLLNKKNTPDSRREGLDVLRRGVELGGTSAMNNLAWALCTTPHDDIRDPKGGLEVGARMGEPEELHASFRDTVAACHAANNQYEEAVRLQRSALQEFRRYADASGPNGREEMAETLEGVSERLALYQAGKPFVETDPD